MEGADDVLPPFPQALLQVRECSECVGEQLGLLDGFGAFGERFERLERLGSVGHTRSVVGPIKRIKWYPLDEIDGTH